MVRKETKKQRLRREDLQAAVDACAACKNGPWGSREGGYNQGWWEAMQHAHHAHAEYTYLGHPSANGVLGMPPDAVIVDGDYLHHIETLTKHPAFKVAKKWDHFFHGKIPVWQFTAKRKLLVAWHTIQPSACVLDESSVTLMFNNNSPMCLKCGRGEAL